MLKFTICTVLLLSLATLTVSESKKKVLIEDSLEACDDDSEENFIKRTEKEDAKKFKPTKKSKIEEEPIEDDEDNDKEQSVPELPSISEILGSLFPEMNANADPKNINIPKESLFDNTEEGITEKPILADIIGNIFTDIFTNPDSPIQKFISKVKEFIEKIVNFIKFVLDMTTMLDKLPKN